MTDWRNRGRAIKRLVLLCDNVMDVIKEGNRRGVLEGTDHPHSAECAFTFIFLNQEMTSCCRQNHLYRCYEELKSQVPELVAFLNENEDPSRLGSVIRDMSHYSCGRRRLETIVNQLNKGAEAAHSDDTTRLKPIMVTWLMHPNPLTPQLYAHDKFGHGFHNDATARLLCPVEHDWDNPK